MEYEGFTFEKIENIAFLTLNRPEKLNAFTVKMLYVVFPKILSEVQGDDEVRVLVITGAGKGFCSGADLEQDWRDLSSHNLGGSDRLQPLGAFALSLYSFEKPVVAAINGIAAGAGVSVALLSDIRIASENAKFSLAFVKRGLVPDCGATFLMPRLIGTAKSFELMCTGDIIDAKEAETIGLVNKVVPHDRLMDEAGSLARRFAEGPPLAIAQIKRAIHNGLVNNLEQQLYFETYAQNFCWGTEDFKEGVSSFLGKYQPKFKGR